MAKRNDTVTRLVLAAAAKARAETGAISAPEFAGKVKWPVDCTVGPGLEGAIACESKVGYVDGTRGKLLYRGYDIFDLCAYSTFEEVSYLLLQGHLPTPSQLKAFDTKLKRYRSLPNTLRSLMGFPLEELHPMAALRLGTNLMRQRLTWRDIEAGRPDTTDAIAADEDSIGMETPPVGEEKAIYEFKRSRATRPSDARKVTDNAANMNACMHLVAGVATLAAAIGRVREDKLPIEPDPELSHAANFLYMLTGKRPSREEERIMDVALILHADHGMNASTFASLVVASTLADVYYSVGSGIAALSGPLHGGANEAVVAMLADIGEPGNVKAWFESTRRQKRKVMGMGHRVYKTYDPRARVLAPLAEHIVCGCPETTRMFATAKRLESHVVKTLGKEKMVFPNVDFYSGLVYECMGIPREMFTPIFAVSRVAGWTARIHEYLQNNRIFRPRAIYVGDFDNAYVPLSKRESKRK